MDIVSGIVSMFKDIKTSDREFRNLNFQLKYTLQKAHLLLNKIASDDSSIAFMIENLNRRVTEG